MDFFYVRLCKYLIGLFIKSLGLVLIICSNFGTGSWEGLYVGLFERTDLSVGFWIFVVGFCLVWLNAFLLRKGPNFYSFVTITIVGLFIDFWLSLIDIRILDVKLQVLSFWVGLVIASFGVSTYLHADFSPTPVDQLMFALSDRFKISLMAAKTIGEIGAFIIAVCLHGPIGLGTVIFTLLFGPFIQFFISRWNVLLVKNR